MCGIFAQFSTNILDESEVYKFRRYLNCYECRGPDNTSFVHLQDSNALLGHTRLSIIDTSEIANQPYTKLDRKSWLLFNGEIYNYKKLRSDLIRKFNIKFRSGSDTEVLYELCSLYPLNEVVSFLDGMYSFVYFDAETQEIKIARDPFGEKPLYVGNLNGLYTISSTLQFLQVDSVDVENVNESALTSHLAYGYVKSPDSVLKSFTVFPAGHYAAGNLSQLSGGIENYTESFRDDFLFKPSSNQTKITNNSSLLITLKDLICSSLEERMACDRDLGFFMSSGVDSALLTAIATKELGIKPKTFTVGFTDASSEHYAAEEIANHLGCEHETIHIAPGDLQRIAESLTDVFDEPFSDYSQIPLMHLCHEVKDKVTVAITGDGADELFCGYNRYIKDNTVSRVAGLPLSKELIHILGSACDFRPVQNILDAVFGVQHAGPKLRKLENSLRMYSDKRKYYQLLTMHSTEIVEGSEFIGNLSYHWNKGLSTVRNLQNLDLMDYLQNDIFVKSDRTTMAYGIEARAPFLARNIVSFAHKVDQSYLIKNGKGKFLLRELLAEYLPVNLQQKKKKGFGIPLDQWLRTELKTWASDAIYKPVKNQLVDQGKLEYLWQQHLNGKNYTYDIWIGITHKNWIDKFVK